VRRWPGRVALAAGLAASAVAGAALLGLDPDPLTVPLLVALALACLAVVLDGLPRPAKPWLPSESSRSVVAGRDGTMQAHLRLLENHRTSRDPGPEVRDRLARLADRTLALRHQTSLDAPRARELLGDDVVDTLRGPVVRLSRRRIDHLLTTIEGL
jgi:hypothetical protein